VIRLKGGEVSLVRLQAVHSTKERGAKEQVKMGGERRWGEGRGGGREKRQWEGGEK